MRKIVIITVIAVVVSQMFCGNVYGQCDRPEYSSHSFGDASEFNRFSDIIQWLKYAFCSSSSSEAVDVAQLKFDHLSAPGSFFISTGNRLSSSDFYIDSNGNIGIGGVAPIYNAEVSDKLVLTAGDFRIENGAIKGPNLKLRIDGIAGGTRGVPLGFDLMKGRNDDVTLNFFVPEKSTRFITGEHGSFSFAAGGLGKGLSDDNIDLHINSYGRVGIGTLSPSEKLTVAGNVRLNSGKLFINIDPNNINTTIKNKYSIFVTGGVLSEDYAIAPQSAWADHVFNTDYKLQNLKEVENFIQENKHLPGIPSAAEVQENGYTLHDMNVKLLQKVEELTLYSIEQNKKIEQLEGVVESYQSLLKKVEQLENKIK